MLRKPIITFKVRHRYFTIRSIYSELIAVSVIPDLEHPDNVQSFDSGAVGHPSAEQIWAFKARQIANDTDLVRALMEQMQVTVPPNRAEWATGIEQLLVAITTLQNVAGALCEATANPKP